MSIQKKPYLVIPHLVEQPTWGGEYICNMKGWLQKKEFKGKKIGQSYELYSKSFLAADIFSTENPLFSPTVTDVLAVSLFAEDRAFPLIKFTQAKGNSFQLHVKPHSGDIKWQPKAESWYFFEDGDITFGVKKGASMHAYKKTCFTIEARMKELSILIAQKRLDIPTAERMAKDIIKSQNPWQYVNVHKVKKGDVVDLSGGGLHHSWEENPANTLGNIVYEVQQDVMDPVSTLRSFDQGKLKEDGSIREIQVETYFKHLDVSEGRNTLTKKESVGGVLFDTEHYSLSLLSIAQNTSMESTSSFHHLFIKEGKVEVVDKENHKVTVGKGHSCFIPQGVAYEIKPIEKSDVLLTFLR